MTNAVQIHLLDPNSDMTFIHSDILFSGCNLKFKKSCVLNRLCSKTFVTPILIKRFAGGSQWSCYLHFEMGQNSGNCNGKMPLKIILLLYSAEGTHWVFFNPSSILAGSVHKQGKFNLRNT